MPISNSSSVQVGLRVRNVGNSLHYDHLVEKANLNPDNPNNHVGTEINALIAADYDAVQQLKQKSKKKK